MRGLAGNDQFEFIGGGNSAGNRNKCCHVDVMSAGVHGSVSGGPSKACLFLLECVGSSIMSVARV